MKIHTMKKLSLILLFFGLVGWSQTETKNSPEFKFDQTTIDYGNIEKGSDGYRTFVFTNIGNAPLIVSDIRSSCGCTIPEKPLEPIMPGKKGEIKVHYDTNRVGAFQKNITIYSNAKTVEFTIFIKGVVVTK